MENSGNPFGLSEDELKFVNQKYVKAGLILIVVGIVSALVIWGGINIAPLIALALANWLWALAYLVGVVLAYKIVTNRWLIRAISRFIDNQGYKLYIKTIQINPIETAENNLAEMQKTAEELDDLIGDLQGAQSQQDEQFAEMEAAHKKANGMAIQARQDGDETMAQVYMEEALGYKTSITEAKPYYELVSNLVAYYEKAQKWVQATTTRYRNTLESKKRFYRIAEISADSVKKIKEVMGGPQFKEFSIAINEMSNKIHNDVGKVRNFMRATKPIMDKQDFEARAYSREANMQFAEFVKEAPFLNEADKQNLLGAASVEDIVPAQLEAGSADQSDKVAVPVANTTSGDKFNRF